MGKITSLIEFSGKVGNLVGSKGKDGRNVLRKHQWTPRNPKSILQMRRRVAWANLVNLWNCMIEFMKPSFENKPQKQSDYNAFMQANVDKGVLAYLKKNEALAGVTIVTPVTVTRGSLPSVALSTAAGGRFVSNIALGDFELTSQTSVGSLTHALLNEELNAPLDLREGDQITLLVVKQEVGENQMPVAKTECGKFILDLDDTHLVKDVVPNLGSYDGVLATASIVNGGVAFIHSRKTAEGTFVSSQMLSVNNDVLQIFCTASAQDAAIASYGGAKDAYLTPTGDQYAATTI